MKDKKEEEKKEEEKKEEAGGAGEEKKEEENKEDEPLVLKVEMHCGACAKKVAKSLKGFQGIYFLYSTKLICCVTACSFRLCIELIQYCIIKQKHKQVWRK